MIVDFVKMHGLGNDFMVVDWPAGLPVPAPEIVRRWADRRTGVGFDSLLVVKRATNGTGPSYRVLNADGGEAEQCGNGARCIAQFLSGEPGSALALTSAGGVIEARVLADGYVSVNLGEPDFRPAALPFAAPEVADRYRLALATGQEVEFGAVSMGNPHAVVAVDSVDTAAVGILGAELGVHDAFPRGVNVGFMERTSEKRIRLRVFERGVGETRACGTGAAAAVAVGRRWGWLAAEVDVSLPGGTLSVRWQGPGSPLWQTGPTTRVYEGRIEL